MIDHDTSHRDTSRQTALTVLPRAGGERRRSPRPVSFALVHPDSSFIAHLIATAAQEPQTRTLRRASPEDVLTSYRSVANQNSQQTAPRPVSTSRVA